MKRKIKENLKAKSIIYNSDSKSVMKDVHTWS